MSRVGCYRFKADGKVQGKEHAVANKRKESLAQFNRQAIVQAADALFARHGVAKTTMDDIAKAADYSKATLYVYFQSKEDILHHIIYGCMTLFRQRLEELARQHSGFESFFFAACELLVTLHDTRSVHFAGITGTIAVTSARGVSPEIVSRIYAAGEETNAVIVRKMEQDMAAGRIRPDVDPLESALVLWSCISGIIAMVGAKTDYLASRLKKDRKAFMQAGFAMLLNAVKTPA